MTEGGHKVDALSMSQDSGRQVAGPVDGTLVMSQDKDNGVDLGGDTLSMSQDSRDRWPI